MKAAPLFLLAACNTSLQEAPGTAPPGTAPPGTAPPGTVSVTVLDQEVATACAGEEVYSAVLDVHVYGGPVTLDMLAVTSLTDDADMVLEEVYGPEYADLDGGVYLGLALDEGVTRFAIKARYHNLGTHAFLIYALSYEGLVHGMLAEGLPKAAGRANIVTCE